MSVSRGRTLLTEGVGIEQSELPPFEEGRLDPRDWFQTPAPLEIEIGSGKGSFLVAQARARSDVNYLGVESAGPYYRYAADRVRRWELPNVRVLRADAVEFLTWWCDDDVAEAVHVYFSDPWPKKRHHKRRVIQDRSLRRMHGVLRPEGRLHLVTDHEALWDWYEDHAARLEELFERRPFERPQCAAEDEWVGTNYERKFARDGRVIRGMTLVKR